MITYPRTVAYDFSLEGQQQILLGDPSRVWVQFLSTNGVQYGIDFVQRLLVEESAFFVPANNAFILTKGDYGSILGSAMYATTGPPSGGILLVTEIIQVG